MTALTPALDATINSKPDAIAEIPDEPNDSDRGPVVVLGTQLRRRRRDRFRSSATNPITTDALREVLRMVVPPVVLPELHRSNFELVETSSGPELPHRAAAQPGPAPRRLRRHPFDSAASHAPGR